MAPPESPQHTGGALAPLDVGVLALYAAVLLATGWWFSRRRAANTNDYFLAGRSMPVWAVAVSVMATALSAATFIGAPQQSYDGNLTYLASYLGMVGGAVVVAWVVIPALYRADASTPYALLRARFGPGAQRGAAAAFLAGRVMASGARIYIIGIPAALILFGEPLPSPANPQGMVPAWQIVSAVAVMTVVGIVYTFVGGIRSVIWTDAIQMGVFVAAVAAAAWLLVGRIPGGLPAAASVLTSATAPDGTPKLAVFDLSLNFTSNYTLFTCCTAFLLMGVASQGLDQDLVQRMLTCRTSGRGSASVVLANLAMVPVVALLMLVGLLLYVFYRRPDVMGDAAPSGPTFDSARVFLSFILRELPPGLAGLMLAGLFAAGLSSLNSGLNSMSSTVVNDFYRPLRPGRPERHYLRVGRVGVVGWGLVLGGFACLCVVWQRAGGQTLIDFALGVMTFSYAGLLGVFATALLTRRGTQASAIAALIAGALAVLALQPWPWLPLWRPEEAPPWIRGAWSLAFPWKLAVGAGVAALVAAAPPSCKSLGTSPG